MFSKKEMKKLTGKTFTFNSFKGEVSGTMSVTDDGRVKLHAGAHDAALADMSHERIPTAFFGPDGTNQDLLFPSFNSACEHLTGNHVNARRDVKDSKGKPLGNYLD